MFGLYFFIFLVDSFVVAGVLLYYSLTDEIIYESEEFLWLFITRSLRIANHLETHTQCFYVSP